MKKGKIKLLASIASLALVVVASGVGVWAAVSQTLNVSATVKFDIVDAKVTVSSLVKGDNVDTATVGSNSVKYVASTLTSPVQIWTYSDNSNSVSMAITLTDNSRGYIPKDATITVIYQIHNDMSRALYFATPSLTGLSDKFTSSMAIASNIEGTTALSQYTKNSTTYQGYELASGGNAYAVFTFTVKADTDSIATGTSLFTSLTFGFYNGWGHLNAS